MFSWFSNFLSNVVAIDLGTANTLVFVKGEGIVLNEPSVVAVDQSNSKVYAVGIEAKAMLGKTPDHIVAVRPLKDGVIADVIALDGIVSNCSIRVAGDEMDDAIVQYVKKTYNLLIGEQTAELIKMKLGTAWKLDKEVDMEVKGRDLVAGIPKTLKLNSEEIREALSEPISQIVEALKQALEETPPELAADIVDRGIVMTGGGSLLRGLDTLFKEQTNLPINVVDDPLLCVVLGAGKVLNNLPLYDRILMQSMHD
ncbi:MAG: rod shape-determining protein [bacterium]